MVASDPGCMNALVVVGGQVPLGEHCHPFILRLVNCLRSFFGQPLMLLQSSQSLLVMNVYDFILKA